MKHQPRSSPCEEPHSRKRECDSGIQLCERINGGGSGKRNPDYHRKLPSVCCVILKCVLGEKEAAGNEAWCSAGCSVEESLSRDPGSAESKVCPCVL